MATATPTTGFWSQISGQYSYNGDATECTPAVDLSNVVDPITVIARLHYHPFLPERYSSAPSLEEREWESAARHLEDHGWDAERDRGQYFRGTSGCREGEISLADSNLPNPGLEQFHARGHQIVGVNDPYHYRPAGDDNGTTVTPMTPHFDEVAIDPLDCGLSGHYIEEDYLPDDPLREWSGFDRGREELIADWLEDNDSHHAFVQSQFWGRPVAIKQCNDNRPRANGYVYHVGLCPDGYPC